ncbi:flagellar motor switch protein FliG [Ralstonia sp. RRA.1]|uniref:flagellar motor switch protein FliG n=1 Tax=Ralstonia sp. RRA TaxID=3122075 RepID=UPI0030CEBAF7
MSAEGLQRSAILMMSLGESEAAEVLKHLGPREVQKLGATMAALKNVSRERVLDAFDAFFVEAEDLPLDVDSNEYIRTVFRKALGDDRAANIIDRILSGGDTSGIEGLKWMDASSVAEVIRNEHPQIIATILVHLDRDQASEILTYFTERLRNDTILRIATLDGIQPSALRELNDVLTKLLQGNDHRKKNAMGGVLTAAEILNLVPSAVESAVIEGVRSRDPELADAIVEKMFVFDNLIDLDGRSLQTLLREVSQEVLVVALKGAKQEFRDKVFANMSQRAGMMLKEELEVLGPVKVSEVEAQQKEILVIARRLADEGEITIGRKAEDAYV